jgi:F0F1-type ATP synthase assembly protein I
MQFALAMELPFLLVACVVLGGLFGYWLDGRLGTSPGLLLLFGLLGFAAGVREMLRRLKATERLRRDSPPKPPPSS